MDSQLASNDGGLAAMALISQYGPSLAWPMAS